MEHGLGYEGRRDAAKRVHLSKARLLFLGVQHSGKSD